MIQFFVPLMTHSSPSCTAKVRMDAGSEPASGSDSANAGEHSPEARRGSHACLSSSDPKSVSGSDPSSWIMRMSALEAQTLAISSTAICSMSVPVPVPPYSVPNGSPRMSCSPSNLRMSCGYSPDRSMSAARGAICSWAIWRTRSRKSRRSCGTE